MTKIEHNYFDGVPIAISAGGPPRGAIHVGDGLNIEAKGNVFNNVPTPFDFSKVPYGEISGSRIMNDPKLRSPPPTRTSTGWRRPPGPPLPIFCSNCKAISPSRNYVFGGMYFRCWDNEEPCPRCDFPAARLSEGLFNLAGEAAAAISAPELTHVMLAALANVAKEFVSGRIDVSEAATRFSEVAPKFRRLFQAAADFLKEL